MQVYDGTRVTGIAARPIRAGEEVSDNYYPSAPCVARPERRRWLAEHFLFHCECGACSDNLPLLADMPDTPARFLCQQCPWSRLSPADSCCPRCGAACDPEQLTGEVSRLVTALATAVQLYQAAATADPRTHLATVQRIHTQLRYMEYFQLKNIFTQISSKYIFFSPAQIPGGPPLQAPGHGRAAVFESIKTSSWEYDRYEIISTLSEKSVNRIMTVKDANFEKGVADFFGDAEVAEKYMKLKSIEEKIKLIWTAPVIQVDIYLNM